MSNIEIKNAIIVNASIFIEDHGLLTASLSLDYGDTCQAFGGWSLYLPNSFKHHNVNSVAGHFIFRVMEIAGVSDWSALKGKTIRVKGSWDKVYEIGHIIKEVWFCPEKEFKNMDKKEVEV